MEPIDRAEGEEDTYTPRDFADWSEIPSKVLERQEVREKLAEALKLARANLPRSIRTARHGTTEY